VSTRIDARLASAILHPDRHITAETSDVCRRLDRRIQTSDPYLFGVYDRALRRYQIWRNNPSGTRAVILTFEENGKFVHPDDCNVEVDLFQADLARNGRTPQRLVDDLLAHNQQMIEKEWEGQIDEMVEIAKDVRGRIATEESGGAPRYPIADVIKNIRRDLPDTDEG
jgi:hypothetical protein